MTGLTHRRPYADTFAITFIKTTAVFVVIAVYLPDGKLRLLLQLLLTPPHPSMVTPSPSACP